MKNGNFCTFVYGICSSVNHKVTLPISFDLFQANKTNSVASCLSPAGLGDLTIYDVLKNVDIDFVPSIVKLADSHRSTMAMQA